ncbi:MAG: four helix bundle protein [Sphingobacteriales bacterium]|nr:MAG: four helix bundle protein [Sphingobacteriales bacterium]
MDYNEIFRFKTKEFAIEIIEVFSALKYNDAIGIVRKQIIRSATSIAANYRAMCRARSDKERFSKLSIVVEEADETLFWLELAAAMNILNTSKLDQLINKATEILKTTATYRKKLSNF